MKPIVQLIGELPTADDLESRLDRRPGAPQGLVLHHTKGPGSPHAMARHVVQSGREGGLGHLYTWHLHEGTLHQCWPVDVITNHARGYSAAFLSVCVTGSWDEAPWPAEVLDPLVELAATLSVAYQWGDPGDRVRIQGRPALTGPRIGGHREYRWGSTKVDAGGNVTKSCPGEAQDLRAFRHLVRERVRADGLTPTQAWEHLLTAGHWLAEGVWL